MVDICVEILASSVERFGGNIPRYRVKTWWAHIDVPPNVTLIRLPRLPMIQQYLIMTGKDTTLFVETWQEDLRNLEGGCSSKSVTMGDAGDDPFIPQKQRFIGMTTCCVDEQLKNPNLNPSVQWLDVHDPIEDAVKGRLLVKVDARFATPNSTNEKSADLEQHEIPGKAANSPRRSFHGGNYIDEDFSPTKQSIVSSQSRKSDTSMFSMGSIASSRSQEQGIQTDLSLPVISSRFKYTSAIQPQLPSEAALYPDERSKGDFFKSQNGKASSRSSTIIDPLRYAEDILLRHSAANGQRKGSSELVLGKPPVPSSKSNVLRKHCLMKQNQQHSIGLDNNGTNNPILEDRRYSTDDIDLENVGDVIDMLNHGIGSRLSPPSVPKSAERQDHYSRPNNIQPRHSQESASRKSSSKATFSRQDSIYRDQNSQLVSDSDYNCINVRQAPEGRCVSVPDKGSPSSHEKTDIRVNVRNNNNSDHGVNRFKEVHFDGTLAKQNAADMLMTNSSPPSRSNDPPVTRRRIAAAIFND